MLIIDFRDVANKGTKACLDAADFLKEIKNGKIAALGSVESMSWGERILAMTLPGIALC